MAVEKARRGLGLVAMSERAALSAGTLELLLGRRRRGTRVRLRVPIVNAAHTAMTKTITVLLADDHALVRRGFRRLLEDDPAITVVGEASDGDEAIRLAAALKPGVVVMDAAMPGTSGLAAIRRILAAAPEHQGADAQHALGGNAGPPGDGCRRARLRPQERARSRPGCRRAPGGGRRDRAGSGAVAARRRSGADRTRLTPRELEVLQLICNGLSNREIAERLELSVNTVAVHRANIMNALDVHKTAELVVYAIQHGLVNPL